MAVNGAGDNGSAAIANAMSMEREASRRIAEADRQVKEYNRSAQQQLDELKTAHEREAEAERARHEAHLESERQREYRAVRDLQKQSQAELNRTRRQGESDLSGAQMHYREAIIDQVSRGEREMERLQKETARAIEFQNRGFKQASDAATANQQAELETLQERYEDSRTSIVASQKKDLDQLRETGEQAREKAQSQFEKQFAGITEDHEQTLDHLWNKANLEIRRTREGTAAKLAAYQERQKDPFYKLVDLQTTFEDLEKEYIVTARIPEHERERVVVSLKGNTLVISGVRKNEESLKEEDGSVRSTSAYQSYYESIPILAQVDAKGMVRTYEDDRLIVSLPKKDLRQLVPHSDGKKAQPEKVKAERPKFPENLPGTKKASADSSEKAPPQRSGRGDRPLG